MSRGTDSHVVGNLGHTRFHEEPGYEDIRVRPIELLGTKLRCSRGDLESAADLVVEYRGKDAG
jgi:hypothetical protein